MDIIVAGLLVISVLLLIISFFLKDPYKELKNELDEFSMQQVQDLYQIKRKLKVLEEELLIEDTDFAPASTTSPAPTFKKEIHAIIKNQVLSLTQQGLSVEQIAIQSSLPIEDVKQIISEFYTGDRYE